MTIGMLGFGEVAQAIFERIGEHWELSIKRILSPAPRAGAGERFTDNADDILRDSEIDAVIDALEGGQPSLDYAMRALKAGKHVVSLNGEMLAPHLKELMETAQRSRVQLKVEPAVGVGAPYLSNLIRLSRVDALRCVFGTASGVCNLILDAMQSDGIDMADALGQAQRAGRADADPSRDVDGLDSRDKLSMAASVAFGLYVPPESIDVFGIRSITREDVRVIRRLGYVCRLLMRADQLVDNRISACVEPTLLRPGEPEATVRFDNNLLGCVGHYTGEQYFFGPGRNPRAAAASAVLCLKDILRGTLPLEEHIPHGSAVVDNTAAVHRYYVRTDARLSIPAERLRGGGNHNLYLTMPLSVSRMHSLAAFLRLRDPNLFFAGVRG